ncbi:CDP-diacylglycerol--serine O-phosphatidyltransferase [Bacteroides sp. 214]|uniref:CDP-diacylglycerol--serine O-phosphatidyltransferase n=1 Tax=Bacteroides sp. 214 TaxID=2302935 RepID=UPI0013D6134E|nr:CDP-diacylglycerol--serine O-phosphatidyltransferase [Bacteroides sp. 214]NDW12277.1 CDP-diacylglycerol--serine O-phosphatidyltransferase [Bacteroides sp. 214]
MANAFTRHIPNTITCLNLFSGSIACVMAFESNYTLALGLIVLSAIFDFFDGMFARVLHAYSPIGKELDSLADDISFGFAPAVIVFSLFKEVHYPSFMEGVSNYFPYLAFIIAIFSALRLAKFNIDERQTSSFIGLPTPANALFWASLAVGAHSFLISPQFNAIYLFVLVLIFSLLLTSEIPMFSLKFKNLSLKSNYIQFIFLIVCVVLLILFKVSGLAACIAWYIALSLFTYKKSA